MPAPPAAQPSFIRAPLAWGGAIAALCAPFAFVEPVRVAPPPDCTDWLWCNDRLVGLAFDPVPDPLWLFALLAVPAALIAFLAARIAARGANPRAHWFMAGPLSAILGASILFLFWPVQHFFVDTVQSDPAVLLFSTLRTAMFAGVVAGLLLALLTLVGAIAWRRLRRAGDRVRSP